MAKVYNGVSDFLCFPRDQSYSATLQSREDDGLEEMQNNQLPPGNMLRHRIFAGNTSTPFDSYHPAPAFSSGPSTYFGTQDMRYERRKGNIGPSLRRHTPSGSPSPSISHAFDHPPSNLSSTSGASAQSTASSADGSPYALATQWPDPLHGLGIAPGTANGEAFSHDSFPPADSENDLRSEDSNFAHYVGEYQETVSPSFSTCQSIASSVSPISASQNSVLAFPSPPLALDTTVNTTMYTRHITIDSILDEANSKTQKRMQLVSPVSAASPRLFLNKHQMISYVEQTSSFKSPITPASAVSRFSSRAISSHSPSDHVCLRHSSASTDDAKAAEGSQCSASRPRLYSRPASPCFCQVQSHYGQSQNLFFGQSSGRFVALLESSCWFSLSSPFSIQEKILSLISFSCFRPYEIWKLKANIYGFDRSLSHPAFRYARHSHHNRYTLPWCKPCISERTSANFSTTITSSVGRVQSRLTSCRVCKISKWDGITVPAYSFLPAIPTEFGST